MKKIINSYIFAIIFSTPLLTYCSKCKECYIVEEVNGSKNEIPLGEYCGDELTEIKNQEYVAVSGTTYNECR